MSSYWWQVSAAFLVGAILELLSVGSNEIITIYAEPEHFGRVGGAMKSIFDMGALAGPLMMGVLIDAEGPLKPFLFLAFIMAAMAFGFWLIRGKMGLKENLPPLPKLHEKLHRIQ